MSANLGQIEITEVMDRSSQGHTNPFICRDASGRVFYVKGIGATRRSQVAEWVCAQLAEQFGLPIAPYALAYVSPMLLSKQIRSDLQDLGDGLSFASRQIPHAQELNIQLVNHVPQDTAMDVLVFDWWVRNSDRTLTENGGNPNLLWSTESEKLRVIDHNLAFDTDFKNQLFFDLHVFRSLTNDAFCDFDHRNTYAERLLTCIQHLSHVRDSIPEEWWINHQGDPVDFDWLEIETVLRRAQQPDFWNFQ